MIVVSFAAKVEDACRGLVAAACTSHRQQTFKQYGDSSKVTKQSRAMQRKEGKPKEEV